MKVHDIAVVLINYNSSAFTIKCISSILEHTADSLLYCISIVDNASEPDDYNALLEGLTSFRDKVDLHLFRSRINTGFSTGNMLGVQFISARYYFFLNNDCMLKNDCLTILYRFCESNANVGLCSPQLHNEKGKPQPCFDYFPYLLTKIFGLGILRLKYGKRYIPRKGHYTSPVQVDLVSGSQMFVRATAFESIGGFDTSFFLYCEEEDIAYRLAGIGCKAFLVPEAMNMHAGGGSTTPSMAIKKEFYISFLYFYRKHFGRIREYLLRLILTIRLLRKGLTNPELLTLAIFVASGAHFKHSLRHKQKIHAIDNINLLTYTKTQP